MSAAEALSPEAIHEAVYAMGRQARAAAHALAVLSTAEKNAILLAMAAELRARSQDILAENARDLDAAEANGLTSAMQDRLRLDEDRLEAVAEVGQKALGPGRAPVGLGRPPGGCDV